MRIHLSAISILSLLLLICLSGGCSSGGGSHQGNDIGNRCGPGISRALKVCGLSISNSAGAEESLTEATQSCEQNDIRAVCLAACAISFPDCNDVKSCFETDCPSGDDDSLADDDSTDDDDTSSDDDFNPDAPIITDAAWVPAEFTWDASCADPETPCASFVWHVCDRNNDMLPDGFFIIDPCFTNFYYPAIEMEEFQLAPDTDFTHCYAPVELHKDLLMPEDSFPYPGTFDLTCYIQAVDSAWNPSNKIPDITLSVTYDG